MTIPKQDTRVSIRNGDDKAALIAQLFDIGRSVRRVPFEVTVTQPNAGGRTYVISTFITGLRQASETGNEWVIYGYIDGSSLIEHQWLVPACRFMGVYNTATRQGTIQRDAP